MSKTLLHPYAGPEFCLCPDVEPPPSSLETDRYDDPVVAVKELMTKPCSVLLPDTAKLKGQPVLWYPGYKVGIPEFGPRQSDVMFVGKMMIDEDMDAGMPFSGNLAALMSETCSTYGISYQGSYVTNVVKFQMPYRGVNVPASWMKAGRHTLQQEIAVVKPKFILCLGADAVKAVMNTNSATLKSYRGAVHYHNSGAAVMGTNSPADILRNPEKTDEFKTGFRLFAEQVRGVEAVNDTAYIYIKSLEKLREVVAECMQYRNFAMDCEWEGDSHTSGHIMTIQFSPMPRLSYVLCLHLPVDNFRIESQAKAVEILRPLLQRQDVRVCGHNFRADIKWLRDIGLDLTYQFCVNGFDTILGSHLLSETNEHGLTACSLRDTDIGKYDTEVEEFLRQKTMHWEMPTEVLLPYAAADADATFRLWDAYEQRLWDDHTTRCKELGVEDPYAAVMSPIRAKARGETWVNSLWNLLRSIVLPVNSVINEMEEEGLLLDMQTMIDLIDMFRRKKQAMLAQIREVACDPFFNPNSSKQMQRFLFGDPNLVDEDGKSVFCLGLRPVKSTGKRSKVWSELEAKGQVWYEDGFGWKSTQYNPSSDAETLGILADAGSYEAELLRDFKYVDQICKSFLRDKEENPETGMVEYVKGLVGLTHADGKLRTTISQLTETGRWRSSRPNAQNWPKSRESDLQRIFYPEHVPKIRSGIVAPPGHVLIEADFSSAEIWTLAYISDDKVMKEDLHKKDSQGNHISLHSTVALEIFKLDMDVEEFERRREEKGPEADRLNLLRVAAKSVNFGIPYQRGGKAIARLCQRMGVPCEEDDGNGWVESWYDRYKDAAKYIDFCKGSVYDPQYIRMPFGRCRHFIPSIYEDVCAAMQREACNAPIQGTVADALSYSAVLFQRKRDDLGLKTKVLLAIHDALLVQAPYDEVPAVMDLLQWSMSDAVFVPSTDLHYEIDTEIMYRWGKKFSKEVTAALVSGNWREVEDQLIK